MMNNYLNEVNQNSKNKCGIYELIYNHKTTLNSPFYIIDKSMLKNLIY